MCVCGSYSSVHSKRATTTTKFSGNVAMETHCDDDPWLGRGMTSGEDIFRMLHLSTACLLQVTSLGVLFPRRCSTGFHSRSISVTTKHRSRWLIVAASAPTHTQVYRGFLLFLRQPNCDWGLVETIFSQGENISCFTPKTEWVSVGWFIPRFGFDHLHLVRSASTPRTTMIIILVSINSNEALVV